MGLETLGICTREATWDLKHLVFVQGRQLGTWYLYKGGNLGLETLGICTREATPVTSCMLPSEKDPTLKGQNLLPMFTVKGKSLLPWAEHFPFRLDPFQKGNNFDRFCLP